MKILVTGGAGFIGSHVVDAYVALGHEVVVMDDFSSGRRENINQKAKVLAVDIRATEVDKIFEDERFDAINHHAAHIHVGRSVADPAHDAEINILGTINLMQAAVKVGTIKKVIFASTGGAMYGNKQTPFVETMMPAPLSPYGVSKRAAELYLNFYWEQYHIPFVALRYANVYGPRQNPYGEAGVVAIFCEQLLRGQRTTIFGDGKQTRDYVFVKDVVEANQQALTAKPVGVFNIGTGKETDVNEIYRLVAEALTSRLSPKFDSPRPGEQRVSSLNASLAKTVLGWQPTTALAEGIGQTVAYYEKQEHYAGIDSDSGL